MTELNKLIEISKSDFNLAMTMLKGLDVTVTEFVTEILKYDNHIKIPGFRIVTDSIMTFSDKTYPSYRILQAPNKYFPSDMLRWRFVSKTDMKNYLITYLTAVVNNKTKLKNEN